MCWRNRIENSVSSHPNGVEPSRPIPSVNDPTRSNAKRRNDMFAPMAFRIGAESVGNPL